MESGNNIYHFLEGKSVLITGATGFVAKVLVERILHLQPNIKKLYLLVRANDDVSARQRVHDEIMKTDLFKVVKEKLGDKLWSLFQDKVIPVSGDIAYENLGIKDSELINEMWKEIHVVVNSAAATNFFGRYDDVMAINTFGAINVLRFAKKCLKIQLLIHISTAYVWLDNKEEIILEKPFRMGETLHGTTYLNIDEEKKLADETLTQLQAQHATEKQIISTMIELGRQRAYLHGWANTYLFTKAMGEMLLIHLKETLNVIILRPTIITSTIKEPFPGWIEGGSDFNAIFIAYAKGDLPVFLGDGNITIDMIPVDMVVDFILAVMVVYANKLPHQPLINHIGSSRRNPLSFKNLYNFMFYHFIRHPWIKSEDGPVEVKRLELLTTMPIFHDHLMLRLVPYERISNLVKMLASRSSDDQLNKFRRSITHVIRLAEVFEPLLFLKRTFGDVNTDKLLMAIRNTNIEIDATLSFDSKSINWEEYFMNIHFNAVKKYLMK